MIQIVMVIKIFKIWLIDKIAVMSKVIPKKKDFLLFHNLKTNES